MNRDEALGLIATDKKHSDKPFPPMTLEFAEEAWEDRDFVAEILKRHEPFSYSFLGRERQTGHYFMQRNET